MVCGVPEFAALSIKLALASCIKRFSGGFAQPDIMISYARKFDFGKVKC